MADVIELEVPKNQIQFKLGEKVYTLDLSDKSRASILSKYYSIEAKEKKNNQMISKLRIQLDEDLQALEEAYPNNPKELKQQTFHIDAEFTRKFKEREDRAQKIAEDEYLPFIDVVFGEGSGQEIYELMNNNIIAVNKVIGIVMIEMQRENSIQDYTKRYVDKIEKLKKGNK